MRILGIDPGPEKSGWVACEIVGDVICVTAHNHSANKKLLGFSTGLAQIAIERVEPRLLPFSRDLRDTCEWAIRFHQHSIDSNKEAFLINESQVRTTLLGDPKIKATHLRQAIIDRFGGNLKAIGGVKCPKCKGKGWFGAGRPECPKCKGEKWETPPGPLYKFSKHASRHGWSALAVAVTYAEMQNEREVR